MRKFSPSALVFLLFVMVAVAQDSSSGVPVQLQSLKAAARITRAPMELRTFAHRTIVEPCK